MQKEIHKHGCTSSKHEYNMPRRRMAQYPIFMKAREVQNQIGDKFIKTNTNPNSIEAQKRNIKGNGIGI